MINDIDFLDLYENLGLHPGCELIELKRAYRRRVSTLHPDRPTDDGGIAASELQHLNQLYGATMSFQRRHGRLPGSAQARPPRTRHRSFEHQATDAPRQRSRRMVVLLGMSVAIWLLWNAGPAAVATSRDPSTDDVGADAGAGAGAYPATPTELRLGMGPQMVRQIEGVPFSVDADRWEYGPSWVLFENGRVVDWYSSPLRTLRTKYPPVAPDEP